WPGTEDYRVRCGEVGAVKYVEELRTKLCVQPFVDGSVLNQSEIQLRQAGPRKRVAADISKCSRVGRGEGSRIEPLRHCLGIKRAMKIGIQVGAHRVTRIPAAGRVVAELRGQGETAL